jgi:hypothetical protein
LSCLLVYPPDQGIYKASQAEAEDDKYSDSH